MRRWRRDTSSPAAKSAKPKPRSNTRTITYRVGGSADSASVAYFTVSGSEQQNSVAIPWHKTFKVRRHEFSPLSVVAQNDGGGTITCEIDVDGVKVKAAKSSGQFALVTCDHTIGF